MSVLANKPTLNHSLEYQSLDLGMVWLMSMSLLPDKAAVCVRGQSMPKLFT